MFYNAFSDSSDLVDQAMAYSDIVTGVSIFLFLEMTCEKVLQATGNMVMPMISNMVGCVTNIILVSGSSSSVTSDFRRWESEARPSPPSSASC